MAKPYFSAKDIKQILKHTESIFKSGMLMQGKYVRELEDLFAKYVGTKYAVALNSGTSALQGILNYHDIKDGEVIVPINTFLATANAVIFEGATPVFVDINPKTLCIDTDKIEEKINKKTKGIILVHLAGLITPDIDKIKKLCKKHKIFLIEDASHAHGSSYEGQAAGGIGEAGAFSMLATKVITAGGEGGIVTTNNKKLRDRIISLRFHGEDYVRGIQDRVGHSWRMTEFQAVAGITQIKALKQIITKRMKVARAYDKAFRKLERVSIIEISKNCKNAYYKYPLILDSSIKRSAIKKYLEGKGIQSSVSYWLPCHLQPAYIRKFKYKKGDFSVAEDVLSRTISLPIHCHLTDSDIDRVIKTVESFCK